MDFKKFLEIEKLLFLGVGDKDVYNISKSFQLNDGDFLFGRVEPRNNSELSEVHLFKKKKGLWVSDEKFVPLKNSEDPFISFIDGKLILGCVEVRKINGEHDFDPGNVLDYRTVLYSGEDPCNLKRFWEGPWTMKDIRFVQLPSNRVAVFSRPQGKIGGRGKIGFLIVDSLDELNEENLYRAPLLDYFSDLEWGGTNDIHLLKNGNLGILGHVASKTEEKVLSYYPMIFIINPETREHSEIKVLFTRSDIPKGESKSERHADVIFPGGLVRKDGTAELFLGVGDAEAYRVVIKDPFLEK